jgi:hypothetical protein
LRLRLGVELDHRSRACLEKLSEPAVGVDTRKDPVTAVHVVAGAAMPAKAARDERMNDNRVADGDVLHRRPDGVHPAGVLMAQGVGQLDVAFVLPLTFDDMEIGPAKSSAANTHDDIVRSCDLRVGHFFDPRTLAISLQTNRFHGDHFFCSV